jgi:hypothetical protein
VRRNAAELNDAEYTADTIVVDKLLANSGLVKKALK